MRADIRVFRTEMLGSDEGENPQGRVPRLETKVAAHAHILQRWQPVHFLLRGVWLLLVGAAGYLANHFFPVRGH